MCRRRGAVKWRGTGASPRRVAPRRQLVAGGPACGGDSRVVLSLSSRRYPERCSDLGARCETERRVARASRRPRHRASRCGSLHGREEPSLGGGRRGARPPPDFTGGIAIASRGGADAVRVDDGSRRVSRQLLHALAAHDRNDIRRGVTVPARIAMTSAPQLAEQLRWFGSGGQSALRHSRCMIEGARSARASRRAAFYRAPFAARMLAIVTHYRAAQRWRAGADILDVSGRRHPAGADAARRLARVGGRWPVRRCLSGGKRAREMDEARTSISRARDCRGVDQASVVPEGRRWSRPDRTVRGACDSEGNCAVTTMRDDRPRMEPKLLTYERKVGEGSDRANSVA